MVVLPARAKLNLALEVTGRRGDGFHDLHSVVVPLDWHDLAAVDVKQASRPRVSLRVTCPDPARAQGVPTDASNLAHIAATRLLMALDRAVEAAVWLDKRLPAAAGLGGGSADAAAVLRALGGLLGAPEQVLQDVAATVGSDVPAILLGGRLLVSGRGEVLEPLPRGAPLHMAVVVAGASATAATYRALTDHECRGDGRADRVAAVLRDGTFPAPGDLGSRLEPAAVRCNPALGRALARLRAAAPDGRWHLTGSGGGAFALAPTAAAAQSLAVRARALGMVARACRTIA